MGDWTFGGGNHSSSASSGQLMPEERDRASKQHHAELRAKGHLVDGQRLRVEIDGFPEFGAEPPRTSVSEHRFRQLQGELAARNAEIARLNHQLFEARVALGGVSTHILTERTQELTSGQREALTRALRKVLAWAPIRLADALSAEMGPEGAKAALDWLARHGVAP
jgi:hypothetical protein